MRGFFDLCSSHSWSFDFGAITFESCHSAGFVLQVRGGPPPPTGQQTNKQTKQQLVKPNKTISNNHQFDQPFNNSISRSIVQPTTKPINRATHQPNCQSISQFAKSSINQTATQTIKEHRQSSNQASNQPINQSLKLLKFTIFYSYNFCVFLCRFRINPTSGYDG